MKTGSYALEPPKMSPGAQNIKTRPEVVRTAENEFQSAKYENWTSRSQYGRKCVRECKT
jgi:hypothetical protein